MDTVPQTQKIQGLAVKKGWQWGQWLAVVMGFLAVVASVTLPILWRTGVLDPAAEDVVARVAAEKVAAEKVAAEKVAAEEAAAGTPGTGTPGTGTPGTGTPGTGTPGTGTPGTGTPGTGTPGTGTPSRVAEEAEAQAKAKAEAKARVGETLNGGASIFWKTPLVNRVGLYTDHNGLSYKGYIGFDRNKSKIAHYGYNFGDRVTHWDLMINNIIEDPLHGHHFVVSFWFNYARYDGMTTVWLSAKSGGSMSVQFSNSSDEKFVIRGTTKSCSLQRLDHYKAGTDSGYLRAHTLLTDRDQADITADGNAAMDTETKFHLGVIGYWGDIQYAVL